MNKNHIIYKVQNSVNGKVYIGATTNSIHQRKLDHTERAKRGEQGQFQEAIDTYGPEAFTWTQIDSANTVNELAQKEKKYVIHYDSKENGYNSDSGGGIQKTVYQYAIEEGSLVNTFDCLESAANVVSASKRSISSACLGINNTCKGYYWSYSLSIPFILQDDRRSKRVLQMDLKGVVIAEYKSVSDASKAIGISKTCIARVCRKERNHSGGFRWSYS